MDLKRNTPIFQYSNTPFRSLIFEISLNNLESEFLGNPPMSAQVV
jgi:hypothetical protein